jgi:hypothetical protein
MSAPNHCQIGGSGMSKCGATSIKVSSEKELEQAKCFYFVRASFSNRCMFEIFDRYCWSIKAQIAAKG